MFALHCWVLSYSASLTKRVEKRQSLERRQTPRNVGPIMSIGSQCPGRVWKDKSVIHHSLVPLRLFLELFHIVLKGRMQSFKESLSDYLISHFQEPLLKYNLAKYTLQTEDESQCT